MLIFAIFGISDPFQRAIKKIGQFIYTVSMVFSFTSSWNRRIKKKVAFPGEFGDDPTNPFQMITHRIW